MQSTLIAIGVIVAIFALHELRVQRWLRKIRDRYVARKPPPNTTKRLEDLARLAVRTLGATVLDPPDIDRLTLDGQDDSERLKTAVELCARRFALDPQLLLVSFARLPEERGAEVEWDVRPDAVVGPSGIELKTVESARCRVRVDYSARDSDTLITALLAHELAHVALRSRGVWLDNEADNELLTEAAVVCAGFGPLMRQSAYVENVKYRFGGRIEASVNTSGYLHEESIDRLIAMRASLRHGR